MREHYPHGNQAEGTTIQLFNLMYVTPLHLNYTFHEANNHSAVLAQ